MIIDFLLIIFFSLPGLLVFLRDISFDLYVWQIKEYRLDRLVSFIVYDQPHNNRTVLFSVAKLILVMLLGVFWISPGNTSLLGLLPVVLIIYAIELSNVVQLLVSKRFIRPKLKSIRNLIILVCSLTVFIIPTILLLIWVSGFDRTSLSQGEIINQINNNLPTISDVIASIKTRGGIAVLPYTLVVTYLISFGTLVVDLLSPVIVSLFVMLTAPLSWVFRQYVIFMAGMRIKRFPKLKIIAITGSFGKTTTKEILYQLLSQHFNTVRTPKNNNTAVGIAFTILNSINTKTELFIAEMGAYKRHEIRQSTSIAKPDVAIITGINEQHQSLFGSIENVIDAKYEIVENLKEEGLAVLNGNDSYCMRIAEKTPRRKALYFSYAHEKHLLIDHYDFHKGKSTPHDDHIYAVDAESDGKYLTFTIIYHNKNYKVKTNLPGIHNISNLLAAVAAALDLGMKLKEIVTLINNTKFEINYLNLVRTARNIRLIDDGYNTNPEGIITAVKYMDEHHTEGKRWLITQGIQELGKTKISVYERVAKEIQNKIDGVITTDKDFSDQIKQYAGVDVIYVNDPNRFDTAIKLNVNAEDTVLIEGPVPERALIALKQN